MTQPFPNDGDCGSLRFCFAVVSKCHRGASKIHRRPCGMFLITAGIIMDHIAIGKAIASNSVQAVQAIAMQYYNVELVEFEAVCILDAAMFPLAEFGASWSGWSVWFKSRIANKLSYGFNKCNAEGFDSSGCQFNFFFPNLEESDEMLARLRFCSPDDVNTGRQSIARSGISKSTLKLVPIDRTADNVTQFH